MKRTQRPFLTAVLATGLLLSAPAVSVARDHHVATTGDDMVGAGTSSAPWRTIGKAVQIAESGDVIIVHEGTYPESIRIRLPNITLKSADDEWAVIQSPIGTGDSPQFAMMFDVDAWNCKLQRLELIGGYYTVFLQTRWDWGDANRNGASDILIEDCKIHESGRDCIKITPLCERITIRRCEIYNSGRLYPPGTPFENKNAEGVDVTSGNRVLVQDCYIHDTATTGIYFKGGAADCVVERTRVERCGQAGVLLGFDTSPEFFDLTANPEYYECVRGIVRNCIVEDTNYAGIGFYAARDSMAVNNTIINTARVAHSPIYFGITFQDWWPDAGRPASTNVEIANNVVAQLDPIAQPAVYVRYSEELDGLSALDGMPDMHNNLYFLNGGAPRFSDARPTSTLTDADLAGWQTHISGDADSFTSDPLLADDGRLTADSPAIDAGAAMETVTDDFDRQARSAVFDIGADEFGATAPPGNPPGGPGNLPPRDGPIAPPDEPDPDVPPRDGGPDVPPRDGGPRDSETPDDPNDGGVDAPDDGDDQPPADDENPEDVDPIGSLTGGVCPAASLASLFFGMLGVRRARNGQRAQARRNCN